MTASIATMTIAYYLQNVAADGRAPDLTSYYVSSKAPPGRWFGRGLGGLNVDAGDTVAREDAVALFQDHADPGTGEKLGRPVMAKRAAPVGAKTPQGAPASATRTGVHGFDVTFSPPKSVSTLWALSEPQLQGEVRAAHQQAVEETLAWVEANVVQSRSGHGGTAHVPVTGISASLFDHWESRDGDPQLHTHAVIVNKIQRVSDGEWITLDSFTMHRHMVAISEKYDSLLLDRLHQRVGSLTDSRDPTVARSVEALLAATESPHQADPKLGQNTGGPTASSAPRASSHRVELLGVPEALIDEFSSRARAIEDATDGKVAAYAQRHGHRPTNDQILEFRRQATLESRQAKSNLPDQTLPEKMHGWRQRALNIGYDPDVIVKAAVGHPQSTIRPEMLTDNVIDAMGSWALNDASMRRTTFSRANILASAERVTRLVRCETAAEREQMFTRVVDDAMAKALPLTPGRRHPRFDSPVHDDPSMLNRGASVFDHRRTAGVFTTDQIMDEEAYLIARVQTDSAPSLPATEAVESSLTTWRSDDGHQLSEDQWQASKEALTSTAGISAIIGPAGTGKTTTMSAITDAWQSEHGEGAVIGLAPSAVAAGVLSDEIGGSTENTAKWLHESVGNGAATRARRAAHNESRLAALVAEDARPGNSAPWRTRKIATLRAQLASDHAEQAKYQLHKNQLLIVDEASMVATPQLTELASQAEQAGAKVLLVGDPAQLEAVDAGGFLGHMERNLEVSQLNQVWRFKNDWEKQASLAIREGREDGLDAYVDNDRVHGDLDTDAVEDAYARWKADHDYNSQWNDEYPHDTRSSILIASDNATVAELNQRAHEDRIRAGEVDINHPVTLREQFQAGVGDTLLARKNDRSLRDSQGQFVSNGTLMTLAGVRPDGSAEATVRATGATVTLDKAYLAESVELGYAVTAHRAQGLTVTTGHAVVSEGLSRELFYVAMTRGKESNDAYVQFQDTDEPAVAAWDGVGGGVTALHEQSATGNPVETLKSVLARAQAEQSAHEVQETEHGWAKDLGRMAHERSYLTWASRSTRTQQWVRTQFTTGQAEAVFTDGDWQRLVAADPATNFSGPVHGGEPAAEIISRCTPGDNSGHGPAKMFSPVEPANSIQTQTLMSTDTQLREQLAVRASEARRDRPDWYATLADRYPDAQVPADHLDAVLVWRAASNQASAPDPLGKEPPARDYLRPFWDRLQVILHPPQPEPEHQRQQPVPLPVAEAMVDAWDQLDTGRVLDDAPDTSDVDQWVAHQQGPAPKPTHPAGPGL